METPPLLLLQRWQTQAQMPLSSIARLLLQTSSRKLFFFPSQAKGNKLTCKIDRICFQTESQSCSVETGHFSPQTTSSSLQWTMIRSMTEWVLKRSWSQTEASQWHPQGCELNAVLMWNWDFSTPQKSDRLQVAKSGRWQRVAVLKKNLECNSEPSLCLPP